MTSYVSLTCNMPLCNFYGESITSKLKESIPKTFTRKNTQDVQLIHTPTSIFYLAAFMVNLVIMQVLICDRYMQLAC